MAGYGDYFSEHLRLTILRVLAEAPAYTSNSSILHSAANDLGLPATRDQIRTELSWLQEQRLITVQDAHGLAVVTLAERGLDAAEGRAHVPGIKRPAPRG